MTIRRAILLLALVIASCTREIDEDLVHASASGNVEEIKRLLSLGANIEAVAIKEWTPLTAAADNGQLEAVKTLIEAGAKVDAPAPGGVRAWELAAIGGHEDVVACLLQAGADIGGVDSKSQQHILTIVRQKNFRSLEDLLVAHGLKGE
jgi:ankyrin repeat protein